MKTHKNQILTTSVHVADKETDIKDLTIGRGDSNNQTNANNPTESNGQSSNPESNASNTDSSDSNSSSDNSGDDAGIDIDWNTDIPTDLAVDTSWDDVYQANSFTNTGLARNDQDDYDDEGRRGNTESLNDHLLWQLNLTQMSDRDLLIAESIIDAVGPSGMLE